MMASRHYPSRLLMTADAVGGVWQYALELTAGLCRHGTRVVLAVMGPPPSDEQRTAAAAIPGLSLRHRPYRLEWMRAAEDDLEDAAAWLAALEAELDPDIVHLNGYGLASGAWSAPVVVVCHSCVHTWWQAVREADAPPEWSGYAERVAHGLLAADLVVAPTRAFLAAIERVYGPQPQTMVIANGRSGPFGPSKDKLPLVFSCGRAWDEAKGTDLLDRLAERLPWPVYLAGDLRSPDGSAAAGLSRVHKLGRLDQDQLADWLARTSIFALPARYEPFGLAVLEAAMSGCALVLGDIETLRELWDGAALFADHADDEALLKVTTRLIDDKDLCAAMGSRALHRANTYRAEKMVDAYVRAYHRASLHRNRVPAPLIGTGLPGSNAEDRA